MQWFMVAVMYLAGGVLVYLASQEDEEPDPICSNCHGMIEIQAPDAADFGGFSIEEWT